MTSLAPFGSQRSLGASTIDWCYLAAGRYDLYLHGGQRLWDYAAGIVILEEAGGQACTLDSDDYCARPAVAPLGGGRAGSVSVRAVAALGANNQ